MTVLEALTMIRELKRSQYRDEVLTGWLSELDGKLWQEVVSGCENAGERPPLPYSIERDEERELLAAFPHEGMYMTWLSAKIDWQNGEYDRYNNALMMFEAQLAEFAGAWIRSHKPLEKGVIVV